MPDSYDFITFDCYGTLIDWDRGIREALLAAAQWDDAPIDPTWALEAYHALEPVVQAEAFRSYRAVLAETVRRAAEQVGWAIRPETAASFAASVPTWPAFADTGAALQRLALAGYRLGILSNVDDDLLAGTRRHFAVPFELIVTAQQVKSYKPAHSHFLRAREQIGEKRWLHAAQSHFHDVTPCAELKIPCIWVNRKHEQIPDRGAQPIATVSDLAGLADWLGA